MKLDMKLLGTKSANGQICTAFSLTVLAIAVAQCHGQALPVSSQSTPTPKKLYIEEFIMATTGATVQCNYGFCLGDEGTLSRNISLEVTRAVLKKCPSILTVTDNRGAADYDLRISPGGSTLYKQNGDVAYQSPTKFRPSNLAKEVCKFVAALTPLTPTQSQTPPTMVAPTSLSNAQAGGDSTAHTSPIQSRSQVPFKGIDPVLLAKAQAGDAVAEREVGRAYFEGEDVPKDSASAALWFRKAAEQGNNGAQFGLGLLYDNGNGVPQDYAQAAFWYRKAAEQGNAGAQFSLAGLYHNGHGLPQDYAQAAAWYRKAAEQGFDEAQTSLGSLYLVGEGVPQDYTQAITWFGKAAEQGDDEAQYGLGVLNEYVLKNYPDAYFWLSIAAANTSGSKQAMAVKSRDEVAAKLTSEDLSMAQQRATAWFAAHQPRP